MGHPPHSLSHPTPVPPRSVFPGPECASEPESSLPCCRSGFALHPSTLGGSSRRGPQRALGPGPSQAPPPHGRPSPPPQPAAALWAPRAPPPPEICTAGRQLGPRCSPPSRHPGASARGGAGAGAWAVGSRCSLGRMKQVGPRGCCGQEDGGEDGRSLRELRVGWWGGGLEQEEGRERRKDARAGAWAAHQMTRRPRTAAAGEGPRQ